MRESETHQHNRQREFQNRVLAALEKPKRSRFLGFLNAPIFLWFLSALALSFGSTVYQTRQQCLEKSEALIANQFRTRQEIISRIAYFKEAVLSAESPKQLQDTLRKRKSLHADLRTKTLFDLLEDEKAIVNFLPIDDVSKIQPEELSIADLAANSEINEVEP